MDVDVGRDRPASQLTLSAGYVRLDYKSWTV